MNAVSDNGPDSGHEPLFREIAELKKQRAQLMRQLADCQRQLAECRRELEGRK